MKPTQVNNTQMTAVLEQMRALREQAAAGPRPGSEGPAPANFAGLLENAVNKVNGMQHDAAGMAAAFERGEPGVSLVGTMVATQKASIAFQAMSQVRNHLVRAYQDIMNMPV